MRLFLDTNILVFFIFDHEELCADVKEYLFDYSNPLFTSTVCVQELIHLCQIGKISGTKKKKNVVGANDILPWIKSMDIKIVPVNEKHLATLASLPLHNDHRDPNDRLIVAQAITDRVPLVSSDRKFARYEVQGLDFIRNIR